MKKSRFYALMIAILILNLMAGWFISPAVAASVDWGPGNQGKYGSRESGMYVEYSITGVDMASPIDLHGGIFQAYGVVTSDTVTFSGVVYCGVGKGAVTDCMLSASLTTGRKQQGSYVFPAKGEDGWISDKVVEKAFSWTAKLQPGDEVDFHAFAQICGGVCARASIGGSAAAPTPTPTRTITPTLTPTVTPTPNPKAIHLQGKVTVPKTGVKAPLPPDAPTELPLQNVAVTLFKLNNNTPVELAKTFSLPISGDYEFTLPAPGEYILQVDLRQGFQNLNTSFFSIRDDTRLANGFIYLDAQDPQVKNITYNLSFSSGGAFLPGKDIPADHLQTLGLLYYFTHQALDLATLNLSMGPRLLKAAPAFYVQAYATGQSSSAYIGKFSDGTDNSGGDPHIVISPADSVATRSDLSFAAWHEFGHYVMAVTYDGNPWGGAATTNHDGFLNPNSTDSWIEGWATFYAMLVGKEIAHLPTPAQMYLGETLYNYEINLRAWANNFGLKEESAVAGLLWDLVDPVDAEDVALFITNKDPNFYKNFGITLSTPITVEKEPRFYGDYVQASLTDLWKVLSTPSTTGWNDRSPAAPATYNYIFDVRQLYTALKAAGVGKAYPGANKNRATEPAYLGLSALDELFVAHGFFADVNPQNLYFDHAAVNPVEEIGFSGNREWKYDPFTYPTRLIRRSPAPVSSIYLSYTAKDFKTGTAMSVSDFNVAVRFDAPFQKLGYTYRTTAQENGKLRLALPDWSYPFTVTITAGGPATINRNPLQFGAEWFWQRLSTLNSGAFYTCNFDLDPKPAVTNTPASSISIPGLGDLPPMCPNFIFVLGAVGLGHFFRRRNMP